MGFTWVSLWSVDKVITWVGGRGHVLPLSGEQRVVLLAVVVGVEELLEPLHKLKVVLELPFYELLHGDDLPNGGKAKLAKLSADGERGKNRRGGRLESLPDFVDAHAFKSCLKNFEVVYVFVLQLGLELDLLEQDAPRKQHVHELAVGRPCKHTETKQQQQQRRPLRTRASESSALLAVS